MSVCVIDVFDTPWVSSAADKHANTIIVGWDDTGRGACGIVQVPANRSLILEGPKGDLAAFGVHSLTFTHTPGHCRGHVVYHHKPTGYMLAGDFADVLRSA